MKEPTSSSRTAVLPEESLESLESDEKIKITSVVEQRIYQLACEARAHGMFSRIPPCHEKSRAVAEAIATVVKYELTDVDKPASYIADAMKVIRELDTVKIEEQDNIRLGMKYVMNVLRCEYQNYTDLCLQRGYEEKGELFQLISYFPKIGMLLRKINANDSKRYAGAIDLIQICEHDESSSDLRSAMRNLDCAECKEEIIEEAEQNLNRMITVLNKNEFTLEVVDQVAETDALCGIYPVSRKLLTGLSPGAATIDILRKIQKLDVIGLKEREKLFEYKIRQQKVFAMFILYGLHHYDLEEVESHILGVGMSIGSNDEQTRRMMLELYKSFGEWKKFRESMNTPSLLSRAEENSELTKKVKVLEEENKSLKEELAAYKAIESAKQKPKKHDNKQAEKRKAQEEEDDDEDDELNDTNQPSTSRNASKSFC